MVVPDTRSLATLAAAAATCEMCELYRDAEQTVFGEGPRTAALMLVGEQPGDVEDRRGHVFVGPAGHQLDRVLDEAGLDRDAVYVTNAVKHFHFEQRGKRRLHQTPRAPHITACRPWLHAEARALRPALVVCMGAVAVRSALGSRFKVQRDRGAVFEAEGLPGVTNYLITIHPSAILRGPDELRAELRTGMVADLRVAAEYLRSR
jgi:uracil-DNA glycosylase